MNLKENTGFPGMEELKYHLLIEHLYTYAINFKFMNIAFEKQK